MGAYLAHKKKQRAIWANGDGTAPAGYAAKWGPRIGGLRIDQGNPGRGRKPYMRKSQGLDCINHECWDPTGPANALPTRSR